jgi:predicted DNA-binding antitoxin AbrB/MazE fold protein
MEKVDIEAVYERGTLKLPRELPLQEGQKVTITIHPTGEAVKRLVGLVPWHGSQEDLDYLILSEDNSSLETS